jgi:hypothetical protein
MTHWMRCWVPAPVEVLVCIRKVVAEGPNALLADVIHVDAWLRHQDATKHRQLHRGQVHVKHVGQQQVQINCKIVTSGMSWGF